MNKCNLMALAWAAMLVVGCSEPAPSGIGESSVSTEAVAEISEDSLDALLRQPGTAWQQLDNHTKATLARTVVERIAPAHSWGTEEQIVSISYVWDCMDRIASEGPEELRSEQIMVLSVACAERSDPAN